MTDVDLDNLTDSQYWALSTIVCDAALGVASVMIRTNRHMDYLLRHGWSKEDVIAFIQERTT